MAKQLIYSDDARKKLLTGIEKLAKVVGITLGPTGKNVILDKEGLAPLVTKDGVTVSKEISLEDPFENIGAKLINVVAQRASDGSGDGTTTATVLALAIYQEGLKNIAAGAHPMAVKRGIDLAVKTVISYLASICRAPETLTDDDVKFVATVSSNGDEAIGEMMLEAFQKVGADGVITVEEGNTSETKLDFVEGMQFDKGYLSPHFANNDNLNCELENPLILIYEKKISNIHDLVPLMEKVIQINRPLLIIAEDVEGEALTSLLVNKMHGNISVCAVKAPNFGDRRKAVLADLAILTGAEFISEELGFKLESVGIDKLGTASKVKIEKDSCTIISGKGKIEDIKSRVNQLRTQMDRSGNEYDREKFSERLAKLTGGVAVIRVGAVTEVAMKQTKSRIEDALYATRAAIAEGVLPGGGVALVRAVSSVWKLVEKLAGDEKSGAEIIARAIVKPFRTIVKNTGADDAVILEEVVALGEKNVNIGYDANTGNFVDMFKAGIIDPVKVVRYALESAASVAGLMLTTEVVIASLEKDNKVEGAIQ